MQMGPVKGSVFFSFPNKLALIQSSQSHRLSIHITKSFVKKLLSFSLSQAYNVSILSFL